MLAQHRRTLRDLSMMALGVEERRPLALRAARSVCRRSLPPPSAWRRVFSSSRARTLRCNCTLRDAGRQCFRRVAGLELRMRCLSWATSSASAGGAPNKPASAGAAPEPRTRRPPAFRSADGSPRRDGLSEQAHAPRLYMKRARRGGPSSVSRSASSELRGAPQVRAQLGNHSVAIITFGSQIRQRHVLELP